MDRDSSVGIATRYGLHGPRDRIPGGGEIFWARPKNGYRVFIPGAQRPGGGVDHPPYLAQRLKKEKTDSSTPPLGLQGLLKGELHIYKVFSIC